MEGKKAKRKGKQGNEKGKQNVREENKAEGEEGAIRSYSVTTNFVQNQKERKISQQTEQK